jgi:hypothetical protein
LAGYARNLNVRLLQECPDDPSHKGCFAVHDAATAKQRIGKLTDASQNSEVGTEPLKVFETNRRAKSGFLLFESGTVRSVTTEARALERF